MLLLGARAYVASTAIIAGNISGAKSLFVPSTPIAPILRAGVSAGRYRAVHGCAAIGDGAPGPCAARGDAQLAVALQAGDTSNPADAVGAATGLDVAPSRPTGVRVRAVRGAESDSSCS